MHDEALPTKMQIEAISDVPALSGLKDEAERRTLAIETQLEFSDGSDLAWERSATAALAHLRYTERLLIRRIRELGKNKDAGERLPAVRPDSASHAETLRILRERPYIRAELIDSIEEIDEHRRIVATSLELLERDRSDEIRIHLSERDERFVLNIQMAIKALKRQREELQARRGQLSRRIRAESVRSLNSRRERLFIEHARKMLRSEEYDAIWQRVLEVELDELEETSFANQREEPE